MLPHAAGEGMAAETPRPQLGRGLELPALHKLEMKSQRSFSPQLGSCGQWSFSKAPHTRRQAEPHHHPTAGWENRPNNRPHTPVADATAARSPHGRAAGLSFEGKGACRYPSLTLSQQRRLQTSEDRAAVAETQQRGEAAGSSSRPPAELPLKTCCLRVNRIPLLRGAGVF